MKNQSPTYIYAFLFIWAFGFLVNNFIQYNGIGFWDGHRTELDRIYEILYPIYIFLYSAFCLTFLYLLTLASIPRKNLWRAGGLFMLLKLLILLLGLFLKTQLEHGQGG